MNKKAIFINTASQVTVRFITLAFTLVSLKLLTNYLGTSGVGEFNTITTYINFFLVIADLGLFSVSVREIAKNPDREKQILSNAFIIRLVSALIVGALSVILVFFTKYDQNIKLGTLIASSFLVLNLLASVYDIALQYRLKMQYSALAELLSRIINITALIIIIRTNGNFLWVTSTIALSGLTILFFKWLFSSYLIRFTLKFDKKIALWILDLSIPLGLVYIVNNLFFKLDTLMLFVFKGSAAVGIYTVAYKILEVTAFIGSYFSSALKPVLAENINKDKEYLGKIISKSIIVMLYFSLPIILACVLFSREIIVFISNDSFLDGSKALIFLSLTLPFIYMDVLLGEILVANDSRKLLIRISILMLIFNFSANLFAIPRFSYMGAAATTIISEILLMLINIYYTKKLINYNLNIELIWKIAIVFVTTFLFTLVLRNLELYFIFTIVLSSIFYFTTSYTINLITYKDLKSVLS